MVGQFLSKHVTVKQVEGKTAKDFISYNTKTFVVEMSYLQPVLLLRVCSRIAQPHLHRSNEPLPNYQHPGCTCPTGVVLMLTDSLVWRCWWQLGTHSHFGVMEPRMLAGERTGGGASTMALRVWGCSDWMAASDWLNSYIHLYLLYTYWLFALKKARAAGRNVGICCLIKVGKRESVLNMQEPTGKLSRHTYCMYMCS